MYVKITNGNVDTYPYSVGQLRRDNPHTSFPRQIPDEILESYGVHRINYLTEPAYDQRTERLDRDETPSHDDGQWVIGWTVVSKTAEEVAQYDEGVAFGNRERRNALLSETDYLALSDVTMTTEQAAYRQALRDITTHANWPNFQDADWPTKP